MTETPTAPQTHVDATFEIGGWDQVASADPDAGEAMARAVITKTWAGDVVGTSVAELLMAGGEGDAGRAYLAQERVVGTLAGRSGTFVLQHGAAGGEGFEPRQWAFVVPGSGTGELLGLAGEGLLEHGVLSLDVRLPGASSADREPA